MIEKLEIVQSRMQSVIDRLYKLSAVLIAMFFIAIYSSVYSGELIDWNSIRTFLMMSIAILIFITVWLLLFNSGPVKVIELGLTIDNNGVTLVKNGSKENIDLKNYDGYSISKGLSKKIQIISKQRCKIIFSFYAFSKEQRNILLSKLDELNSAGFGA